MIILFLAIYRYFYYDLSLSKIQHPMINKYRLEMIGNDLLLVFTFLATIIVITYYCLKGKMQANVLASACVLISFIDLYLVNNQIINPNKFA